MYTFTTCSPRWTTLGSCTTEFGESVGVLVLLQDEIVPRSKTLTCYLVPELRIYRFWEKPVGPHPYAMFEVNLFTPAQFGAFVPWLVIWRGPLSVLVHPNTTEEGLLSESELRNHTQRATWMGERVPLDVDVFYKWRQREIEEKEKVGENGA